MKQTVQPETNHAQNSTETARARPAQRQTVVAGNPLAQLAAMINSSPRVQTLAQLQHGVQQRPPVQSLIGLTESLNQSPPNRDVPVQLYKPTVAQLGKKKQRSKPKPKKSVKKTEPLKWKDEEIEGLTGFTMSREGESKAEKVTRIQGELTPLSKFHGIEFNCYAWAMGDVTFQNPGDKLGTWKHRLGEEYDFLDKDDASAAILLWGKKEGDDWEINHASVKLTKTQLESRKTGDYSDSLEYGKETLDTLTNPFWSSAMGAGFGVAAHPKGFFDGGHFGKVVAGMKKS